MPTFFVFMGSLNLIFSVSIAARGAIRGIGGGRGTGMVMVMPSTDLNHYFCFRA